MKIRIKKIFIISLIILVNIITIPLVSACDNVSRVTLSFESNGGSHVSNMFICVYGCTDSDAISLPTPSRAGYIFKGWFLDKDFTKSINGVSTASLGAKPKYDSNGCIIEYEIVTLYAKWYKKPVKCYPLGNGSYTLHYNTNGGYDISDSTICVGCESNTYKFLSTPIKVGYKFVGWYYDSSLKNEVTGTKTNNVKYEIEYDVNGCEKRYKDITIYAKWSKIQDKCNKIVDKSFKLNYISDVIDSTTINVCIGCEVSSYEKVLSPQVNGYRFMGWYLDPEYNNVFQKTSLYDASLIVKKTNDLNGCLLGYEDLNLYAKFKPNQSAKLNITLYDKDDSILSGYNIIIDKEKYTTDEKGKVITNYIKDGKHDVSISKNKILSTSSFTLKENSKDDYENNIINYAAESDEIEIKLIMNSRKDLKILWSDKLDNAYESLEEDSTFNYIIIGIGIFFAIILIAATISNKKS